ncbi:MAG: DUF2382 domain-containing protein [Anaerolineales bacterium]
MTTVQEIVALRGSTVYDNNGEKIGKVQDIYSHADGSAVWIGLGTGFFGSKHAVVPVEGYVRAKDGIRVPYTKDTVKEAPEPSGRELQEISPTTENELFEYYGIRQAGYQAPTQQFSASQARPAPQARPAETRPMAATGQAQTPLARTPRDLNEVIRSEEELRIGTRQVEVGHVRLRKWVETEPVSRQVQLTREHVRVDRQPISEPVDIVDLGEQDIEMTLYTEEPVVEKYIVAKERISLRKDLEQTSQQITDQVRRERIEFDADQDFLRADLQKSGQAAKSLGQIGQR